MKSKNSKNHIEFWVYWRMQKSVSVADFFKIFIYIRSFSDVITYFIYLFYCIIDW